MFDHLISIYQQSKIKMRFRLEKAIGPKLNYMLKHNRTISPFLI